MLPALQEIDFAGTDTPLSDEDLELYPDLVVSAAGNEHTPPRDGC
jgi:hypothetical protein